MCGADVFFDLVLCLRFDVVGAADDAAVVDVVGGCHFGVSSVFKFVDDGVVMCDAHVGDGASRHEHT